MLLKPEELPNRDLYQLVIGSVAPRPIAWVSSRNKAGELNLAPFSYFTVASVRPLTLLFCPQVQPDGRAKDTLNNITEIPEFVVNLVDEAAASSMNITSADFPPGTSEFEAAGLEPVVSETISVPRVGSAPVAFECRRSRIITVSDQPAGGSVVMGEVQLIHVREDLLEPGVRGIDPGRLQPLGRMGGDWYVRVGDRFELPRHKVAGK